MDKDNKAVKKVIKVEKDSVSGLWYYEHDGLKSSNGYDTKKKAWAKGNQYIDLLLGKVR